MLPLFDPFFKGACMYSKTHPSLSLIGCLLLACQSPKLACAEDTQAPRWIPLDDATLLDSQSQLEWTRSDNGRDVDWHRAGRFCGGLPGKWRLPTEEELISIYENTKAPGARCGNAVCGVPGSFQLTGQWFWSADSVGSDGSDGNELAWGLLMVNGARTKTVKEAGDGSRALCVRQSTHSKHPGLAQPDSTVALPIDPSHTAVIFSWTHHGFSHPVARLER